MRMMPILLMGAVGIFMIQQIGLTPILQARSDQIIAGLPPNHSNVHVLYAILEVMKFILQQHTENTTLSNRCGVFSKILGYVGLVDHRYLHHRIGLTNHGAIAPLAQFDRIHNVHAIGNLSDHCVLTV
jgi:hypothetical protein